MLKVSAGLLVLLCIGALPAVAARGCGPTTVQLTVLDQGGSALPGLTPSDFKVWIKNSTTNVTAVDYGLFPHATMVLVSKSPTMGQSLKMEMARQMTQAMVASAPGAIMVGTFAENASPLEDGRSGQAAGADLAAGSDNRNAIYDAVLAGMSKMKVHRGDNIVLITDSPDDGSKASPSDLSQRLTAAGARLFVVALPPASALSNMQTLIQVADATGGEVLVPLHLDATTNGINITPTQVDGAVTKFNHDFTEHNNIYSIETETDNQDRPLPLRVEVDRRKLGGGRVLAPAVTAPCSAIQQ
ncbi:MAG TPA: hypothetical protein VGL89_13425 [Candidatus Koribacter sp.]|jgi:hypothetical protein